MSNPVPALSLPALERALRATAGAHEDHYVWWRRGFYQSDDDQALRFFVNCSDFFAWGCADVEPVTDDTIGILETSLLDARRASRAVTPGWDREEGYLLYCARSRGERPQDAYYRFLHSATWSFFDACGEDEPVGAGNPHPHPSTASQGITDPIETRVEPGLNTTGAPFQRPTLPAPGVQLASDPLTIQQAQTLLEALSFDECDTLRWIDDDDGTLRFFVASFDDLSSDNFEAAEVTGSNLDVLLTLVHRVVNDVAPFHQRADVKTISSAADLPPADGELIAALFVGAQRNLPVPSQITDALEHSA